MIDLTGKWKFKEEFGFGLDEGTADFVQKGNVLNGELLFTEKIDDEPAFVVRCSVKGIVENNNVFFEVTEFAIDSNIDIEYFPEKREGIVNVQGQIVGSSEDEQGICGVFVMERVCFD